MLFAGTPYVGGLHGGKSIAQDVVQVFGLGNRRSDWKAY